MTFTLVYYYLQLSKEILELVALSRVISISLRIALRSNISIQLFLPQPLSKLCKILPTLSIF